MFQGVVGRCSVGQFVLDGRLYCANLSTSLEQSCVCFQCNNFGFLLQSVELGKTSCSSYKKYSLTLEVV